MTVYTVSGPTLTLLGDGSDQTGNLLVADCHNPITGATGPVTIKVMNSSATDVAFLQWGDGTVPTYTFNGVSGTASGSGANATFDVTVTATGYSATIANAGDSYTPAETITIVGTDLGGATPANDATVTVLTANPLTPVTALNNATLSGGTNYVSTNPETTTAGAGGTGLTVATTATPIVNSVLTLDNASLVPGTGYSDATNVATTTTGGGTGLEVDITQTGGVIDTVVVSAVGTGYLVGDTVTITGGNGDATIDVLTTTIGGVITAVSIVSPGQDYVVGEIVTIDNGDANATIEVLTVDPGGEILTISIAGTELWPQPSPESEIYILPNTTEFIQINGPTANDSFFLANCASGNVFVTPVQIIG